jgi:hypothetical protein
MSERKRSSAMLPLIIVGATLFAFGTWQSTRPKEPEVNQGFVSPAPEVPANPRTMQAPDAPLLSVDAAQRAAQAGDVTQSENVEKIAPQPSVLGEPWFMALRDGSVSDFRAKTLAALKDQQSKGVLNCRPTLLGRTDLELAETESVTCLATDGSKIEGRFEKGYKVGDVGPLLSDGEIEATSPDNRTITIEKSGDEFNVREEANN